MSSVIWKISCSDILPMTLSCRFKGHPVNRSVQFYKRIARLKQMDKHRTSETYHATLKSFTKFREDKAVLLDEINSDLMQMYEAGCTTEG